MTFRWMALSITLVVLVGDIKSAWPNLYFAGILDGADIFACFLNVSQSVYLISKTASLTSDFRSRDHLTKSKW